MLKTVTIAALLSAAVGPAGAQSFGFGLDMDLGPPEYGPPPVIYYEAPPQVMYEAPPAVLVPGERRVFRMEAPELVLERLDAAGYRELSPMSRRGTLYRLSAVAPEGDVVALEISIFTGEIEAERVLQPRRTKPSRAVAAPRRTRTAAAPAPRRAPRAAAAAPIAPPTAASGVPPTTLRDRLKPIPAAPTPATGAEPDDDDPLVVY